MIMKMMRPPLLKALRLRTREDGAALFPDRREADRQRVPTGASKAAASSACRAKSIASARTRAASWGL